MPTPPVPEATKAVIREMLARGCTHREIRAETGASIGYISGLKQAEGLGGAGTASEQTPEAAFRENDDGTATLALHTDRPVKTLADLVRVAEVDEAVWHVERWECSAWTVPMKVGADGGKVGIQTQQYRVKAALRRIVSRSLNDALDLVFARFKDAAPRWPAAPKERAGKAEPFLAVPGFMDVHFGKLAWEPETGEHYDLKIADGFFRNAVDDLLAESAHRPVAKFVVPLGNDWFHIDNRSHTTTRGTSQDVDGRFSKVLATGIAAAVWGVERLAAVAPVEVILVPGNHDRTLAECLCHVLAARFHHTERVRVDLSPRTRKYVRFGVNLIGLAHGDLVKPGDLPNVMPAEHRHDWAETTTHEWLTGHGHRSQKWTTKDTDTHQGTVVRQLRALTRTDLWHYDMGFSGQGPAAECYWYGRDRGYAGHTVVPARM